MNTDKIKDFLDSSIKIGTVDELKLSDVVNHKIAELVKSYTASKAANAE